MALRTAIEAAAEKMACCHFFRCRFDCIRHKVNPWFSSQFHPEACSGPVDTEFMFDKFVETLK